MDRGSIMPMRREPGAKVRKRARPRRRAATGVPPVRAGWPSARHSRARPDPDAHSARRRRAGQASRYRHRLRRDAHDMAPATDGLSSETEDPFGPEGLCTSATTCPTEALERSLTAPGFLERLERLLGEHLDVATITGTVVTQGASGSGMRPLRRARPRNVAPPGRLPPSPGSARRICNAVPRAGPVAGPRLTRLAIWATSPRENGRSAPVCRRRGVRTMRPTHPAARIRRGPGRSGLT